MLKSLLVCVAVPCFLSATTFSVYADPAPTVDAIKPASPAYAIAYRLADDSGHFVESGVTFLSRRHPIQMSKSFVRVSYITSCGPDTSAASNELKCTTETVDVGDTLQIALADIQPGAISLAAWVDRRTLDGMQTIQNDGFATQRPLSHGWSDSKTVTIASGNSATIKLGNHYTLTLAASMAAH